MSAPADTPSTATADVAAEDAALVARAREGDVRAYEELVQRHRGATLRVAGAILRDAAEAEDAAQEALIKAYYGLGGFRPGEPFRPWLLRIAANEARNRQRAQGRREGHEGRAARLLAAGTPDDDAVPSPEQVVLEQERRQAVLQAVGGLRQGERQVVGYRYYLDLSEAEMAEALGVARGTVKSRLSRTLVRLRRTIGPSRAVAALAALLAFVAAAVAALPPLREAVADRLGLRGVEVIQVPNVPTLAPAPPKAQPAAAVPAGPTSLPPPQPVGESLGLGEPTSLAAAALAQQAPLLQPGLPELGPPDAVYLLRSGTSTQVSLVFRARPSFAPAPDTGVAVLFSQIRAALERGALQKGLGPGTTIQEVPVVEGARGLWLAGQPHLFFVRDASGAIREETVRLAGNVLLWEQAGSTLRLEGVPDLEQALRVARSVR